MKFWKCGIGVGGQMGFLDILGNDSKANCQGNIDDKVLLHSSFTEVALLYWELHKFLNIFRILFFSEEVQGAPMNDMSQ